MSPENKRIAAVALAAVLIGACFLLTGCAVAEYVVTQTACEALKGRTACS